jgi:hypothetical protein
MTFQHLSKTAVLVATLALTGCASIVNGNNQVISVETKSKGQPIAGASCRLENPKGTFFVTTPGTVTVRRAFDNLAVKCEKDGIAPGLASVKSGTKAMAFGNILFGGVIGAAVDVGSGAAYDYPTLISVDMGDTVGDAVTTAAAAPVAEK